MTQSVFLAHWFPQSLQEVASWGINLEGLMLVLRDSCRWVDMGRNLEDPSAAPSCSDADGRSGVREVLQWGTREHFITLLPSSSMAHPREGAHLSKDPLGRTFSGDNSLIPRLGGRKGPGVARTG